MKKPFSPTLFRENDKAAREAAKKYWVKQGCSVIDNPDRYGPDLIVTDGDETFYCETEIKRVWSGDVFPYETLQIPSRKGKYLELDKPCFFTVWNTEQTHAVLCSCDEVKAAPMVEVPNKFVHKGELFYQVPVTKVVTNGTD